MTETRETGEALRLCTRCGDACPDDRLLLPEFPWCLACFDAVIDGLGLPGARHRQSLQQLAMLGAGALGGGVIGGLLGAVGAGLLGLEAAGVIAFWSMIVGLFAGMLVLGVMRQHELDGLATRARHPLVTEIWSLPEPDLSPRAGHDLVRRQTFLTAAKVEVETALLIHSTGGLALIGQGRAPRRIASASLQRVALVKPLFGQPLALGIMTADDAPPELLHFTARSSRQEAAERARHVAEVLVSEMDVSLLVEQDSLDWHVELGRRGQA